MIVLESVPNSLSLAGREKKKKKNKNRNSDGMEDLLIKGRRLKQTYKGRQVIIWLNLILVATLKALVDTKVYFYYKIYIGKSIYIYIVYSIIIKQMSM